MAKGTVNPMFKLWIFEAKVLAPTEWNDSDAEAVQDKLEELFDTIQDVICDRMKEIHKDLILEVTS
jgi:hypothetical protein